LTPRNAVKENVAWLFRSSRGNGRCTSRRTNLWQYQSASRPIALRSRSNFPLAVVVANDFPICVPRVNYAYAKVAFGCPRRTRIAFAFDGGIAAIKQEEKE
jgi:hypothetical protein